MLSRSHITFGLTMALPLIALDIVELDLFQYIPGVILGSVTPDIDTAKSWVSQTVPLIDRKLRNFRILRHRGLTHGVSGIQMAIFLYWICPNDFMLAFMIGYISHCISDSTLSTLKIKISDKSDNFLFRFFWILNFIIIVYAVYNINFN